MGMSTHIKAFIPDTDPEYQKHKKVLDVCREQDVYLPKQTAQYFGSEVPYGGMQEEKLEAELIENVHYTNYSDLKEGNQGFEVDLTKLPHGVTKLRFYNNW